MPGLRTAEKISGWSYQAFVEGSDRKRLIRVKATSPDLQTEYAATALKESRAVATVVGMIYNHNRNLVLKRAAGRCENCGLRRPLQVHHKQFRSHGRDDRVSNLTAICCGNDGCHEAAHRRKSE